MFRLRLPTHIQQPGAQNRSRTAAVNLEKHLQAVTQLAGHEGWVHTGHEADRRIRVARVVGAAAVPDAEMLERRRPEGHSRNPVVEPGLVVVGGVKDLAAATGEALLREHGRQRLAWQLDHAGGRRLGRVLLLVLFWKNKAPQCAGLLYSGMPTLRCNLVRREVPASNRAAPGAAADALLGVRPFDFRVLQADVLAQHRAGDERR